MDISKLIAELSAAAGPSGYEEGVRAIIREKLEPYADGITTDVMGNLIAVRSCGKEHSRRVMLNAHMDEIGFVVTGHEKGYLRFAALGGVDARMLPARELKLLTPVPGYGVIDVMPPHALTDDEMEKALPIDKLFIDVGMTQEEAEKAYPVGTAAVFAGTLERLGENMLCGKSMDDRACVAILIAVMESLAAKQLDVDVCCMISVQEELGTRGAITGAFGAAPDCAIVVDATHGSTPDAPKHKTFELGGGAAIGIGPNLNKAITNHLIEYAKASGLPYQIEVLSGNSGTDAWPIQVSRGGIATALVSLPVKYMHSPVETMCVSDAENMVELISGFVAALEVK